SGKTPEITAISKPNKNPPMAAIQHTIMRNLLVLSIIVSFIFNKGFYYFRYTFSFIYQSVLRGRRGHNERFSIIKASFRTVERLDFDRSTFNKHQYMADIIRRHINFSVKFQEVNVIIMSFMCRKTHYLPIISFFYNFRFGNKLFLNPASFSTKVQIIETMFNIDRSGLSKLIFLQPVVHLKGEDIWCLANLKNHVISTRAVHCLVRDKKKIMLLGFKSLYVFLYLDFVFVFDTIFHHLSKFFRFNIILKP